MASRTSLHDASGATATNHASRPSPGPPIGAACGSPVREPASRTSASSAYVRKCLSWRSRSRASHIYEENHARVCGEQDKAAEETAAEAREKDAVKCDWGCTFLCLKTYVVPKTRRPDKRRGGAICRVCAFTDQTSMRSQG